MRHMPIAIRMAVPIEMTIPVEMAIAIHMTVPIEMAVSIHMAIPIEMTVPVYVFERGSHRRGRGILFHVLPQTHGYARDAAQAFTRHVEFLTEVVLLAKNRKHFAQFDRVDPEILFKTGVRFENIYRVAGYLREDVPDLVRKISDPGLDSCAHN